MDDKILIEDDIVDLTDLLEEGSPPSSKPKDNSIKKKVNEPDSFDLGKEISMEYDVSVEEIEQDPVNLGAEKPQEKALEPEISFTDVEAKPEKEPLLDIEKEIDMAIQDKFEDVSLTSKEEEMLLKDEPVEEPAPIEESMPVEEPAPVIEEKIFSLNAGIEAEIVKPEAASQTEEAIDTDLESLLDEKTDPAVVNAPVDTVPVAEIKEPEPQISDTPEPVFEEIIPVAAAAAPSTVSGAVPVEIITETLIEELKKEMPSLLENIMRPVVKELLQEVIIATRDALPSLVEKVIREEIEKLKRI